MTRFENDTIAFLRHLVSTPSLSGQESALAQIVEDQMKAMHFDDVWRDELGSVIGVRCGDQPGKHILFDAHMDVVSPGPLDAWQHNPFGAELSDGKIWGRGSTDTKGSLAGMLMALGSLEPREIHGQVSLVASVGEEVFEGIGLKHALEQLKPDGVVVGEPTECRLGIGQKGRAKFWLEVAGKPAHSSTPQQGENAVYKAAALIERIRQLPPQRSEALGDGVVELIDIISAPFPSTSMVPYLCRLRYDRRLIEGESSAAILEEYQQALKDLASWKMDFEPIDFTAYTGHQLSKPDFHPAWWVSPQSDWVRRAQQALLASGLDPLPFTVPYCTNASTSAGEMDIPSLIFGPSSIHLAHIIDEYIEIDEYLRGMKGFLSLAQTLGNNG